MATQGDTCVDRETQWVDWYTVVNVAGPADETFSVTILMCWAAATITTSAEFGSFADGGSNSLTCHGNCSGANMTFAAGSCLTKTGGVDFTAYTALSGEYIGIYYHGSGSPEWDYTGKTGVWYEFGDDVGTDVTVTFTLLAGDAFSMRAEGAAGGLSIPYNPWLQLGPILAQ